MFDGDDFKGMDEDAVAEEAPLDTALVRYLDNNIRYIERNFDRSSAALLQRIAVIGDAGLWDGKVQTTFAEMWLRVIPIHLDRTARRIEVSMFSNPVGGPFEIVAELQLEEVTQRRVVPGVRSAQIEFDLPTIERPQAGFLFVGIRSIDVTAIGTTYTASTDARTVLTSSGTEYTDPGRASLAGWQLRRATGNETVFQQRVYDHLHGIDNSTMAVGGADTGGANATLSDARQYLLPTSQFASVAVAVDYDDDYFNASELRPNIPETSDVVRRIDAIQQRQFQRPRMLSIGTSGVPAPSTGGWPDPWRLDWGWVDGDDAKADLSVELIQPIRQLARLIAYPVLFGVHHTDPPYDPLVPFTPFDDLWQRRAKADWSLGLELRKINPGGTRTVLASASRTVTVGHVPLGQLETLPFLVQAFYRRFGSASDETYTYKEGMLGGLDEQFLQDFALLIEVAEESLPLIPLELAITAELNDSRAPEYNFRPPQGFGGGTKFPPDTYNDPKFLRLYLVGHSVYLQREVTSG